MAAARLGLVLLVGIVLVLSFCSLSRCQLPGQQELLTFQRDHSFNNTMSDLIFLVDVSGSLLHYIYQNGRHVIKNGFDDEKMFVNSLLNYIRVSLPTTRVSVILFSTKASIDINYINNISPDNHKCNFKRSFNRLPFRSGMTNMKQAFEFAEKIIFNNVNKRPTAQVKTAIFLLTDGNWNQDGSPYSVAQGLRENGIEIFAIGVGNGIADNVLRQIATPGRAFRYSGFHQFRKMAYYLRGDPYEKDWIQQPMSKCGGISCDPIAKCACGLLNGEYKCACPEGYYGSGYIGDCKLCPVSTYKSFMGHAKSCTPCPKFSSHSLQGSSRKSDCQCKTGYDGNPGNDSPCRIIQCGKFPVSDHGIIRGGTCNLDYLSECELVCKEGYELTRPGKRMCNLNKDKKSAKWSGLDPTCKEITCPSLNIPHASPKNGKCSPKGLAYKTKCTIKCETGYIMKGSNVRVCQLDKTWSGETVCEEVRCPKLNSIPLTQVNPPECVQRDMRFFSLCSFTCPDGYVMGGLKVKGLARTCGTNGQWDGQHRTCVDVTQPKIKCPGSIITNTSLRLPTALVSWSDPVVQDNSIGADPLAVVTVTSNYSSPHAFKIGKTQVTYKVRDNAGLEASCFFNVDVLDHEAPEVTSCPNDQNHELVNTKEMRVTWQAPTFKDNSGLPPSIQVDIRPGTTLGIGDHVVHYIAKDKADNANYSCEFRISIKAKTCPLTKPPKNGAVACNAFGSSNKYCQVSCNNKYDFAYPPGRMYLCAIGAWKVFPSGSPFPWPDCSVRYDPSKAAFRMESAFYYYEGNCNSPDAQKQIKSNFINLLRTGILAMFGQTCMNFAECNTDNVQVFCGDTDASKRRKRAVAKEVYIKLNFVAKEKPSVPKTVKELETKLEANSRPRVEAEVKKTDWSPLRTSDGLAFKSYTLSHADAYCSDQGAVVGKCDSYDTGCAQDKNKPQTMCSCNLKSGKIEKCIRCPEGTFYDNLNEKCVTCSPGTFQNKEGRFECHRCPEGTWTVGNEAKNFTACREKCKPGYFSHYGLAKCFPCPRGTYAAGLMNTKCTACPQGTTTLLAAATGREDCGMKCAPGTFSASGVEPCTPCPKGTFQDAIGSMSCRGCDGPLSTYGPGADSQAMCIDINDCASNPCNNGGRCVDQKDGFRCECVAGYTGKQCEIDKDECLSDPCFQGSTCVDKVNDYGCVCSHGYTGKNCDVAVGLCSPNPCQNGAKCLPQPPKALCECTKGYEGEFCEIKIDLCASSPCLNDGLCRSHADSFQCTCRPGFLGSQCELRTDECSSDPCLNGGKCIDEVNGYHCSCQVGYTGSRCEKKVNNCYPNPCQNGVCVGKSIGYECLCKPNYSGKDCQSKMSSDYDLTFPLRLATSSSSVSNIPDLRSFTIAFWLRTTDSENPGTPISYATTVQGKVMDNALVLQDYGAFTLEINNKKQFIGVSVNDGHWHHVVVTWRNSDGQWKFYLDGENIKSSTTGFQVNAVIKGGGVLVLGQEQDSLGDGFSPEEAFTGDISQMNLWDRVLSANEVANLVFSCQASEGNVKAWGDFVAGLQGVHIKTTPSHACNYGSKLRGYQFTYESRYPSQDHKILTGKSADQCAVACEAETSFPCRSFDYDRTKRKCYLSKAVARSKADLIPVKGFDFYQTDCVDSFGMEAKAIPDSSLAASSSMDATSGPKEARLHNSRVSGVPGMSDSRGGWSPSVNNNQQYLQVDLGKLLKVTGVATQGGDSSSEWVTSFKLEYSSNGRQWHYYPHTLPGNKDDSSVVTHQVQLFKARFVRIRPQSWHRRISLRADFYGCQSGLAPAKGAPSSHCSANLCINGGTCIPLLYGHRCICARGYQGNTCQTESPCSDPGTPPNGRRSSSAFSHGSTVTFTCNKGYRMQGSSRRTCTRGQWSGSAPQCSDTNECTQGVCGQMCTNTDGSFKCACHKGYQLNADGKTCNDINECAVDGICSHTCHNIAGGFRCSCPTGMELSKGGRSCKDKNECTTSNYGCEQLCANGYLSSACHCKGGFYLESDRKQCTEKRCPSTSAPANGHQSIQGDRIYGNILSITCSPGYKLIGSAKRTCQADGKWSGVEPRCEAVRCPVVGTLMKGRLHLTAGQSYNSKATFSCNSGFALVGMATRTCQQNGQWSNAQPRCVRADCPSLSAPKHGKIEGIRREMGSTVRVSCDRGYRVTPDDGAFRTCGSNKQWTGSDPTCQIIDCGDPGSPWHGFLDGSDFTYNAVVKYRCRVKHFLEGDKERKCGSDGKWTGFLPRCLENSCGNPGSPSNGVKTGNNHTYGSTVRYTCNKGYDLRGPASRTCQPNGLWSGVQPTCQVKNCGNPGTPSNGHRTGNDFTYGNTVFFDCNPGYKLHGSVSRVCQETGTWSGSQATCSVSNCGKIVYGPTGTIQSTNFPNNYPSNEYCTWEIRVPQGKQVRIDFQEFRTEADKDVLLIYDTGKTKPMIAFSGIKNKPRVLTSSGNSLRVRFISNGDNSNNGFKLTYRQTDCGGMLTSRTGEIRSPGFPNGYPAHLSCTWLIRMLNSKISLQLPEFNTENSYDRLEVAHGPWVTAPLEISWSGPRPFSGEVKTQNYMWLHFYSNSKNDRFYRGFRATFRPYVEHAKRK